MSSFQIMQNLYYFFNEVLKDANTREDLNAEATNKALQWAVYCEKVYESCQGKRLEKQVDDVLIKLFSRNKTWNGAPVNINSVKNAVNLLRRALLQNSHLSDSAFDVVMKSYNESDLIHDCTTLAKEKLDRQVYNHLLEEILSTESKPKI